jgi:hypothetical protein
MHSSNRPLCNPPTTATWQVSLGHPTIGHRVTAMHPHITEASFAALHFPIWTFCPTPQPSQLSYGSEPWDLWGVTSSH